MLMEKPLQYFEQTRGITWYHWYVCVWVSSQCVLLYRIYQCRKENDVLEKFSKDSVTEKGFRTIF